MVKLEQCGSQVGYRIKFPVIYQHIPFTMVNHRSEGPNKKTNWGGQKLAYTSERTL